EASRVDFVSDCSGVVTPEAHDGAKQRMAKAGASGIDWLGVVAEWTPDYTSVQRQAVNPGLVARGGGVALSIEYLLAHMQVPAGTARASTQPRSPPRHKIPIPTRGEG